MYKVARSLSSIQSISIRLASSPRPNTVSKTGNNASIQQVSYLQLNLSLRDILLTATTVGDLLCLRDLGSDSFGAEILQGVALDGVDTQNRVWLDGSEATRD